ncbi:MAG TPA: helix-hairpin-helix domain-containing protein [Chitinophagaceae bacterium]
MNLKELIKDYFTFSRKERIGLLIVITLILLVWALPKIIPAKNSHSIASDTAWITAAKKLQHPQTKTKMNSDDSEKNINELTYDKTVTNHADNPKHELFTFDPNTLPATGWKKLGLPDKTISIIGKYLSKGGHFFKDEDLKKIYGVHDDEFVRLQPFIKIETKASEKNDVAAITYTKDQHPVKPKYTPIEINSADTSAFIALPGIGSKLASRIVNFREKLGGFYSIGQVGETYGLPDSTFQKIKPLLNIDTIATKKININTATKDELKSHPYIRWSLANAIVEFRTQHGKFSTLYDLKKIPLITNDVYDKIAHYLVAE